VLTDIQGRLGYASCTLRETLKSEMYRALI